LSLQERKDLIDESDSSTLSVLKQCSLLDVPKSSHYYKSTAKEISSDLLNDIHDIWTSYPQFGYRRITIMLKRKGYVINKKRVQRIMKHMGLSAIYCKPHTSALKRSDYKYPYLLKGLDVNKSNQVWATDITYIKMPRGFVYLCALIDLHSRFILSWNLSIGMQVDFCLEMLESAFSKHDKPQIINTDQGSQFTSFDWIEALSSNNVNISMDGKGRWVDNVFIERFWRTLKQEQIYLNPPDSVKELERQLCIFIEFYNKVRPHQSLGYETPEKIYYGGKNE
jgi:putative transposase